MESRGGGSIVTMTYLGGVRAVPHYNVMGVAKATLDASMRYLAWDLGQEGNSGERDLRRPVRRSPRAPSRASRRWRSVRAARPLHRHIDAGDCGAAAAYLLSDDAGTCPARRSTSTPGTTRWACRNRLGRYTLSTTSESTPTA